MNKAGEENRSVRNTKKRLREGLLRLMADKPINEISVKELTELVDVNRGTFYFHYTDIYDLLRSMQEEFFENFRLKMEQTVELHSVIPYMSAIFSFLGENRDFCKIMLGPHGDMLFVDRIKTQVDERCSHIWREATPEADPGKFELYNAFIINGCIGLIQEWVNDRRDLTVESISELTATLILASVGPCIS